MCTFRLQGTGFCLLIGFVCGMLLLAIFIICSVSSVLNVFMLLYLFITWSQSFKKPSQLALLKFHFRLCLLSIE